MAQMILQNGIIFDSKDITIYVPRSAWGAVDGLLLRLITHGAEWLPEVLSGRLENRNHSPGWWLSVSPQTWQLVLDLLAEDKGI